MRGNVLFFGAFLAILALGFATSQRAAVSAAGSSGTTVQAPQAMAQWTHQGCWARVSAGPCYDIYRDSSGNSWICKACGTTKGAGPGKCNPISADELARGRWCS